MTLRLYAATTSQGKLRDFRTAAETFGLTIETLPNLGTVTAPKEDGETFLANATLKAVYYSRLAPGELVLADDSGLEVDALGGAPGVHSARFAAVEPAGADNSSDSDNNAKLLRLLEAVPLAQRTARFRCVLALTPVVETGGTLFFDGVCEGRIALAPNGAAGFGYDPLFVPEGLTQSFAELGDSVKNQLSHRARALQNLRQFLKS